MSGQQIDFWFTMGSTYSYLSVTRPPDVASSRGVSFRWLPFHLLTLLHEMKHVPEGQSAVADVQTFATGGVDIFMFDTRQA